MVIVANKTGATDTPALEFLNRVETPIPIVLISRIEGFVFNEKLLSLDKYILVDFVEYGWDWKFDSHVFGRGQYRDWMDSDEWVKFDEFVANKPPLFTFKRELLESDFSDTILPIEYPCLLDIHRPQTKEGFLSRPFEVFNYWGRSHEDRVRLHGDIFIHASKNGINVCDNTNNLLGFYTLENGRRWITTNIPYYARIPMVTIMNYNGQSKISISKGGAGIKCFRHSESPTNSVMLMNHDPLKWTHEWVNGENCIKCNIGDEIETIEKALNSDTLYDIYLNGIETVKRYNIYNYIHTYLQPTIKNKTT
jgi:hypothetical protein